MPPAKRLGQESQAVARVGLGGFLHDLGKVGIPDNVLNKPDRLSVGAFDGMTGALPYRKGMPKAKAPEIVAADRGTQFEGDLAGALAGLSGPRTILRRRRVPLRAPSVHGWAAIAA